MLSTGSVCIFLLLSWSSLKADEWAHLNPSLFRPWVCLNMEPAIEQPWVQLPWCEFCFMNWSCQVVNSPTTVVGVVVCFILVDKKCVTWVDVASSTEGHTLCQQMEMFPLLRWFSLEAEKCPYLNPSLFRPSVCSNMEPTVEQPSVQLPWCECCFFKLKLWSREQSDSCSWCCGFILVDKKCVAWVNVANRECHTLCQQMELM